MADSLFEFSIVASGLDPTSDDFESRFFEAGCDDATVSFQKGHIILDFARLAPSFGEAVCSAVECVQNAGAKVDRIEPDPLVNLSDIAERVNMTRAALSQYAKGQRGAGDFPAPVARVTSESPLWEWSAVARWFAKAEKIDVAVVAQADVVSAANHAIKMPGPFRDCLEKCLAT